MQLGSAHIETADVTAWANTYAGDKFHALICDPPYELGIIGKSWDRQGVSFRAETWAALAEHLQDGAFGLAFASSRGWHRLAVAIEDAGLRIHPSIFLWTFGSGFPKATRIADTDEWKGYRYGGQVLKPAAEPIIMFQKPYAGKPTARIQATGAGALNIEGTRIGYERVGWTGNGSRGWQGGLHKKNGAPDPRIGRWAANLILVHHPNCTLDQCVSDCPTQTLLRQRGIVKSSNKGQSINRRRRQSVIRGKEKPLMNFGGCRDEGSVARYFFQADLTLERLAGEPPVFYASKASSGERDAGLRQRPPFLPAQNGLSARYNPHPTVKPIALMRYLATLLLPPTNYAPRRVLVPFAGVGSEMIGALFAGWDQVLGIEQNADYASIAQARLDWWRRSAAHAKQKARPNEQEGQLNLFDDLDEV